MSGRENGRGGKNFLPPFENREGWGTLALC
jgi:hypothetical protein